MPGGRYGVLLYDGDNQLTNTGTISVTNPVHNGATDHVVTGGSGQDVVINSGILTSLNAADGGVAVSLADGDDRFEVQAGSQIWSHAAHSVDFGDYINLETAEVMQGAVGFLDPAVT